MPNDLTTKRNLLDAREDLRLESRRKLASSGFTASTWTLSGVVLVACGGAGEITDALCPNFDAAVLVSCGGGGGPNVQSIQGESHFVQSSPVRGARLYFDTNNNKVVDDTVMDPDIATQDGQYPEGFTTDANGVAENIPEHLFGKPFVAYLDGAINADTGVPFPEDTRYYSIPNAEGQHTIATPITNWIAQYAGFTEGLVRTSSQVRDAVNDVIANFLGHEAYSTLAGDELTAFNLLYAAILDPVSYATNPIIEALSAYLATNPSLADMRSNAQTLINDAQTLIAALMEADPAVLANLPDTLILLHADADTTSANMIDLPDVTIGTNAEAGAYVATVYAVGTGRVSYSIVDENGAEVIGGDFVVDERTGVISVADSVTTLSAETTELYVQVTSGGETETVKIDVTVQSVTTLTAPTTSGTMEIAENTLGSDADPVVTGIDAGSGAVKANFIISDAADSPPGYADKFDIVQDGTTWNLVLRDTESLDYEAIDNLRLRDTQALDEQAIVNGAIKLNVRYQTTNTNDPNNPLFSDPLEFTIMVMNGEDITFSGDFGGVVTEDADADADEDADADADSLVATGSISVNNNSDNADVSVTDSGTYGELVLDDSGTWTYTLGEGADAAARTKIQQLRTGEILVDTATISVASTPATTKNIYITIIGANEDVHFADANDPTIRDISVATVPDAMDIQIGAAALDGSFDLGNVLGNVLTSSGIDLIGRVRDAEPTTAEFTDSVSAALRALFDLDPNGDLSFTGTSAEASTLGIGTVSLEMLVRTPESTTEELPLTVRVNVALADQTISINENDDSPANLPTLPTGNGAITYAITGGNDANRFTIDPTTSAITLNQNVHVNRATGTAEADIFVIDALAEIRAGAGDDLIAVNAGFVDVYGEAGNDIFYVDFATLVADVFNNAVTIKDYTNDVNQQDIIRVKVTTAQKAMIDAETSIADKFDVLGIDAYVGGGNFWFDEPISEESPLLIENISSTGDVIFEFVTEEEPALKGALNYESDATSYTLTVTATDTSNPADTDTATITINVQDVNEAPVFAQEIYTATPIAENLAVSMPVGVTVSAMDVDAGANGQLSYSITAGNTGNAFDIDDNGVITVNSALDYDTAPTSYMLTVTATDGGSLTDTATVNIALTDINDNTPTYTPSGTATVMRVGASGYATDQETGYSITISDADADATNTFSVTINSGDADNRFKFVEDDTVANQWNLVLSMGNGVEDTANTITLGYSVSDGANTAATTTTQTGSVAVTLEGMIANSPAIIPDRQSFAHQDSYDPDDLGLTPMPDADPQAG